MILIIHKTAEEERALLFPYPTMSIRPCIHFSASKMSTSYF